MNGSVRKNLKFRGFARLFVYLRILFYFFFYTLMLKSLRFERIIKRIKKYPLNEQISIDYLLRLVNRILYFKLFKKTLFRVNCLRYSVVLYKLCSDYGIDIELNIGVQKYKNRIIAHAWITREGKTLYQAQDSSYKLLFRVKN